MADESPRLPAFDTVDEVDGPIPEGWRVVQIESLYDQVSIGKRFDQKSSSSLGTVPVIDQSRNGIIGWHDEQPGIVATDETPVVTFANHTCKMRLMRRPFSVIQNVFPLVGKPEVCDTRFLYYGTDGRVRAEEYKGHFPDFRRKWIAVPPLPEQRAIAHILGTVDDKIELNRRMSETLEAMVRSLFESWFWNFDPVRANSAQRDSGLPRVIADSFPGHLQASELGEIPADWTPSTIADIADRIMERVDDPAAWQDEPLIDLGRMPRKSLGLTEWGRGAELTTAVTRFRKGDTLFGAIRPYFHKAGIAPFDGVTNVSVFVIRAKDSSDAPFVAALCSSGAVVDYASRIASGTKMPVVSWPEFARYHLPIPGPELRATFGRLVAPMLDRIVCSGTQERVLRQLRDALHPRLLSGALSLARVERAMELTTE